MAGLRDGLAGSLSLDLQTRHRESGAPLPLKAGTFQRLFGAGVSHFQQNHVL